MQSLMKLGIKDEYLSLESWCCVNNATFKPHNRDNHILNAYLLVL